MQLAGRLLLVLALAIAVYGVCASLYGARVRRAAWVDSGRRAVYALAGTVAVCFLVLEIAFLRSDFSFELVATHSSTTTPPFYRATRGVVLAGGFAPAVGDAAERLVEPDPLSHAQARA